MTSRARTSGKGGTAPDADTFYCYACEREKPISEMDISEDECLDCTNESLRGTGMVAEPKFPQLRKP